MILNISGRTDIVAFYSEWLMNRLKEGYVDVRNPFNHKMVSRIMMDDVELLFFCTKNPIPILNKIKDIKKKVYFHITLTGYKKDIEPGLPPKEEIIKAIKKLSKIIGKENIVIRYDPVFINDKYNLKYHVKAFDKLCNLLDGYINKILISFIDDYKNVRSNYKYLKYKKLDEKDYETIGREFSKSAKKHNIVVHTCAEERNLVEYGFIKDECMSKELAFKLTGKVYKKWKARKNVPCKCIEMADIGVYNSCKHFCKYCYANFDEKQVSDNYNKHDPTSSLLIGKLEDDDIIKIRK
ncbi:MAG: DUF1848 domain-containing protein [Bacilli bacterium]|nr:DUF1848 domain-containing protein [Bacilli bacterium]